jgi:hypothetical protein
MAQPFPISPLLGVSLAPFQGAREEEPMWLFLLWWCVDDHIAQALNAPGVGTLPWWVPLLVGLAFSFTISANVRRSKSQD